MTTIKHIRHQYIDQPSAFAALIALEHRPEFVAHWEATIATDRGSYIGTGETESIAEQAALEQLYQACRIDVDAAVERYNAAHGSGALHIA